MTDEDRGGQGERSASKVGVSSSPDELLENLRGQLRRYHERQARQAGWVRRFIPTGLKPLDAVLPHGGIPCGAITEILSDAPGVGAATLAMRIVLNCQLPISNFRLKNGHSSSIGDRQLAMTSVRSLTVAARKNPSTIDHRPSTIALQSEIGIWKSAIGNASSIDLRPIVYVDTVGDFYPPAAAERGLDLDRLIVIRPRNESDAFWAVDQCLRCAGVAAVVAAFPHLHERLSRRLQLAAESTGCVGVLLRPGADREKSFAAVKMRVEGLAIGNWQFSSTIGDFVPATRRFSYLCRLTLLSVREGMPAGPMVVDLSDETGTGDLSSLPVHRSAARTG